MNENKEALACFNCVFVGQWLGKELNTDLHYCSNLNCSTNIDSCCEEFKRKNYEN